MPFGARLAERLETIFLNTLSEEREFVEIEPPLLIPEEDYQAAMRNSFDYGNMCVLEHEGRPHLLRPDNLFIAARALCASRIWDVPVAMPSQSFYRTETNGIAPLVRDCHIWQTTQIVEWVREAPVEATLARHVRVFTRFLERLCIPTLTIDAGSLRTHSRRRILTYSCTDLHEITMTGTIYEIAPELRDGLGLDGTLIDYGFTTKLLAVVAAVYADNAGLVLPSLLSPEQVVIGIKRDTDRAPAEALAAALREADLERVRVDDGPWHRTLRHGRSRGVPCMVLADAAQHHQVLTRLQPESVPLAAEPAQHVRDVLERHDRELWAQGVRQLEAALAAAEAAKLDRDEQPAEGWHPLGRVLALGGTCEAPSAPGRALYLHTRKRRLY